MSETRKLAAILVADLVGFSQLASADEDRTLARIRALRSDLVNPTIAIHRGRLVKSTGDGVLAEFRSVVDAARCAIDLRPPGPDRVSNGSSVQPSGHASIKVERRGSEKTLTGIAPGEVQRWR